LRSSNDSEQYDDQNPEVEWVGSPSVPRSLFARV
jgi:hypothetical protein